MVVGGWPLLFSVPDDESCRIFCTAALSTRAEYCYSGVPWQYLIRRDPHRARVGASGALMNDLPTWTEGQDSSSKVNLHEC